MPSTASFMAASTPLTARSFNSLLRNVRSKSFHCSSSTPTERLAAASLLSEKATSVLDLPLGRVLITCFEKRCDIRAKPVTKERIGVRRQYCSESSIWQDGQR